MLARKQKDGIQKEAKDHLKNYGWTYRTAAPAVGLTEKSGFVHLWRVLNGDRKSKLLLAKIFALGPAKKKKGKK